MAIKLFLKRSVIEQALCVLRIIIEYLNNPCCYQSVKDEGILEYVKIVLHYHTAENGKNYSRIPKLVKIVL